MAKWKPKSLLFGTPGIPISTKPHDTVNGIKRVKELGLDAMELEFVRSVNVSKEKAPLVKKTAQEQGIILTSHGQYYVNLASLDKAKLAASVKRMVDAGTRLYECGGWSITWHAAFYQGRPKEKVYEIVKRNLKTVLSQLRDKGVHDVWIRPELTGKESQWGDIDEICKISQEFSNVMPCIDFAHQHARYNGKYNTYEEFCEVLKKIEKALGREGLNNMHIQVCGINYTPKGERNHLNLKNSDFNYKALLKAWKTFKIKGVVIDESPNVESDALLLQKTWKQMK